MKFDDSLQQVTVIGFTWEFKLMSALFMALVFFLWFDTPHSQDVPVLMGLQFVGILVVTCLKETHIDIPNKTVRQRTGFFLLALLSVRSKEFDLDDFTEVIVRRRVGYSGNSPPSVLTI